MRKQLQFFLAFALPILALGQINEVVDINPTGDGNPDRMYVDSNNNIFFRGDNGNAQYDTHVWNGSSLTTLNSRVGLNDSPNYFIELDGNVYYQSYFDDGTTNFGNELHRSNGSTFERMTSFTGTTGGTTNQDNFVTANGKLYLVINGGDNSVQLWMFDPALPTSDTNPVKVENPMDSGFAQPNNITSGNLNGVETILLEGRWGSTSLYLLMVDPTTNTYTRVEDTNGVAPLVALSLTNKNYLLASDGNYYFEGDGTNGDDELWVTDGTTAGTMQLGDINVGDDSNPKYITEFQGNIYFSAENGTSEQLYVYNGTSVSLAATINPTGNAGIEAMVSDGTNLYFTATNGTDGLELWKFDGTTATMVKNINASGDSSPSNLTAFAGSLYFSADDGSGAKLWFTDGTEAGTLSVATQFTTSEDPVEVDEIIIWDTKLLFSGTGTNGNELFSFDPSTLSVTEINADVIKIFPNPTTDYLMVPSSLIGSDFAIYTVQGKLVVNNRISSEKINLDLASGLYMIQIKSNDNLIIKKIIVQ